MAKKKQKEQQSVVINDVEYQLSDLDEKQVMLVNHVADLDRKIQGSMFNLDQLQGGRTFFMAQLEEALEEDDNDSAKKD